MASKCCTHSRTDTADLVLHLDSLHAQVAALGQLMQDVGSGGDGVGAQEQRAAAHLRGLDQTPSGGLVARHVGVGAGTHLIALNAVGRHGSVDVVTIVVATLDDQLVGLIDCRLVGKFRLEELQRGFHGAVEQPAHQTQGKHVTALELSLQVHASVLERLLNHRRDGGLDDLSGHA